MFPHENTYFFFTLIYHHFLLPPSCKIISSHHDFLAKSQTGPVFSCLCASIRNTVLLLYFEILLHAAGITSGYTGDPMVSAGRCRTKNGIVIVWREGDVGSRKIKEAKKYKFCFLFHESWRELVE